MNNQWSFWIIDENGAMRCTSMVTLTEEEKSLAFAEYRKGVSQRYPGSFAGWSEGWENKNEINDLKEEIRHLERQLNEFTS